MHFTNRPNELITTDDGRQLWHSRSVAVVSLVMIRAPGDNTYVLTVQRHPKSTHPELWCMPCGFLDWDETGGDAALRETWEESGVDLLKLKETSTLLYGTIFANTPWHVSTNTDIGKQNVVLHFASVFETNKLPKPSLDYTEPDELQDVCWMPVSQAVKHKQMAFNHEKRIQDFLNFSEGMW